MSKCDEIKMPARSERHVFQSDMHFGHALMGKTVKKIDFKMTEVDTNDLKGIPFVHESDDKIQVPHYIQYLDLHLSNEMKDKINFSELSTSTSLIEMYRLLARNVPQIRCYLNFNDCSYRTFSNYLNIIENTLQHEFTQRGSCKKSSLMNPAFDLEINPALYGKRKMNYTMKFFYTEGHTFTASNVNNHTVLKDGTINYYTNSETDTVHSSSQHRVFVDDLLYVEVHKPNGVFEVIPGLIKSFSAVPNAQEMNKVNNVVANENQHKEAAAKRHDKNVKSIAAKRKAQRARELGVTIADLENIGAMQKAERTRIAQEKKAKKNTSAQ